MNPMALEHFVAQHVNELHTDAEQHRLVSERRRGPTDPGIAGHHRSVSRGIRRFFRNSSGMLDAALRPSSRPG
jgi:hypothetical protein